MKYDWNEIRVREAISKSTSYSETLRNLEIPTQGNNVETLKRYIKKYNLDISHFTFGKSKDLSGLQYIPVSEYLNSQKTIQTSKLKLKLLKEGLKENKCECCGITVWNNKPLVMQLHHIDGNNKNNSLDNLQLLCPNCHSQTENYCGNANKNKRTNNYCKDCGKEISKNAIYCPKCLGKHHRKIERPSKEELIKNFKELKSFLAISKIYNVSDKTISNWFIYYGYSGKSMELRKQLL